MIADTPVKSKEGCIPKNNGKIKLMCTDSQVIKVVSSLIKTKNTCNGNCCTGGKDVCTRELSSEELLPSFPTRRSSDLVTQCDYLQECEVDIRRDIYCVSDRNTADVQIIHFECQPTKISQKCHGDYFNEVLCTSGTVIQVVNAYFGVSSCASETGDCCPAVKDCKSSVKEADSVYYSHIVSSCNNRTSCNSLVATRGSLYNCTPTYTDYVQIDYLCASECNFNFKALLFTV